MKTLDQLKENQKAIIEEITAEDAMRRRLWDLGFTKGTIVEAVQKSPSGDPTAYRVRHTIFALRKKDAQTISVKEVTENGIA